MKTRPLCFVCLVLILLQSASMIVKGGESLVEIPAFSIFNEEQEKSIHIHGQVYKKINKSNYQILFLKNNSVEDSRLLIYDKAFTDVPIGKYILIKGKLGLFERATNPGGFDEALFYARQNIYGSVSCEKLLEVSGDSHILMEGLFQLKTSWHRRLAECIGEKNGSILAAMILGEKGEMDADMKELYQNNGISHILAISGLHISFIGLGIYKLVRKTGLGFLLSGVLAMGVLTLYILMIGVSVSAVRAYVMLLLKIGADITGRVYDMLTAAMLGAAMTVLYQPLYLTDGGFYMSYGAILGIAILSPHLKGLSICCASVAINLMLFPITLWFFYVIPTYSVFINMIVLPLTGVVLGLGITGSLLLLGVPFIGEFCLKICNLILNFYEQICQIGKRLPMSRSVLGKPEIWEMMLYYGMLILILILVHYAGKKKLKKSICRISWLLLAFPIMLMAHRPSGNLDITMLDVGQGDGIYLRGPQGIAYFIDGGSSDESGLGKYCIEPFLESQGVGTLDYVFITHGDSDHYSGIGEMITRQDVGVRIKHLVLPSNYRNSDALLELSMEARQANIEVLIMNAGESLREKNMIITCLQPNVNNKTLDGNAGSMVLEVQYGDFSMLCTGDVEGEGEELLLKKMQGKDYDVLKVAHHGSKYSTSKRFLKLCTPDIALISAGEGNQYGHPHEELLKRLEDAGCKIYNTQENGAIMLQTDGNLLKIAPFY